MHGSYDHDVVTRSSKLLQCKGDVEVNLPSDHLSGYTKCNFPGSELYDAAHVIRMLRYKIKKQMTNGNMHAWLSNYHIKHKFASPFRLTNFMGPDYKATYDKLLTLIDSLPGKMQDLFYSDAIDEFLEEHVLQFSAQYRSIVGGYTELIRKRAWLQRP